MLPAPPPGLPLEDLPLLIEDIQEPHDGLKLAWPIPTVASKGKPLSVLAAPPASPVIRPVLPIIAPIGMPARHTHTAISDKVNTPAPAAPTPPVPAPASPKPAPAPLPPAVQPALPKPAAPAAAPAAPAIRPVSPILAPIVEPIRKIHLPASDRVNTPAGARVLPDKMVLRVAPPAKAQAPPATAKAAAPANAK